ncbi:restriction endonuclease subunit S [Bifidobacterium adolescentis]|uniref:restriction endonuclease subunit S n=1 Tax=Bifidobacterium adolescentis TaxID=1680 RepID=UPI001EDBCDB1|nr:restriction endonuclease subunit S [Bifidobacterium adolescentis]MCG4653492.1 restriction endonuclease subunit S [Bifidobacterium adolescentis]
MVEQHEKTLVPQIRFAGFTDPWEQRKLGELYQKNDERNTDGLGSERTLSVASMTFNSAGNGADDSSLPNYKRLRLGDIAFEGHTNKEFAYGRFVLNDAGNGIMSPRFTCLRPIVEQEYSFWKYFIHSEKVMRPILVNSTKSGTMMNELVVEDFLKQEILVPSLPEQRRIGAFFDRLDSLITLHQRKYDKLCVLKKSMLDKMFPKGGSLYPEIRFSGFTDPWEQRKLGEFGSVAMCKRIYKEQTSEQGDVPFFKIGTFGANPDAFISNELFEDFKCIYPYPTPGTLLISAAGSIGRVVEYQGEKAYFQDSNIVWLEHDHRLNDAFLKPLYSRIEWGLEGSTIKRLYNKDLLSAEVTVPGGREQKEIGQFFAKLDNLITLHQRKLELLRNIKKSMLDKMFV